MSLPAPCGQWGQQRRTRVRHSLPPLLPSATSSIRPTSHAAIRSLVAATLPHQPVLLSPWLAPRSVCPSVHLSVPGGAAAPSSAELPGPCTHPIEARVPSVSQQHGPISDKAQRCHLLLRAGPVSAPPHASHPHPQHLCVPTSCHHHPRCSSIPTVGLTVLLHTPPPPTSEPGDTRGHGDGAGLCPQRVCFGYRAALC